MKNLKIRVKLSIAFGVAIAALLGLGAFSIQKLGVLAERVEYMGTDQRDKLSAIDAIKAGTSDFRVFQAVHILSNTPEDMQAAATEMDRQLAIINDNVDMLDKGLKSKGSRAALATFQADWATMVARSAKTKAQSEQGLDDPALASFVAEKAVFDRANTDAVELAKAQSKNAKGKMTEALDTYASARLLVILATLAVAGLLVGLLVMLVRSIASPIATVTGALSALSHGNMDVAMAADDRHDEIGDLFGAMTGLRDQLTAAERSKTAQTVLIVDSIGTGLAALSQGDLTARVDADLTGPFAKLKTDFNNAMNELGSALSNVAQATSGINSGAGDIRQASDDLSHRTEQQAASLEETAAAMDEITSTVRQTADGANRANSIVGMTRSEAEESGAIVARAVEAMGGIERTSSEISEIISVIDGIAFQTNLLALNAGVEAARAGDAGQGLRGGGVRSARAGAALGRRRQGRQVAGHGVVRTGQRRCRAGQRDRQVAAADHRPDRRDQHPRLRDRLVGRTAGDRAAAGQHRGIRDGQCHPAECGDGRAGDRCGAQPGGRIRRAGAGSRALQAWRPGKCAEQPPGPGASGTGPFGAGARGDPGS
jgi:methyl-accepting chemotaxis protein